MAANPPRANRIQKVLIDTMARLDIDPNVAGNLRFFNVRFAVFFRCSHCGGRTWSSAWGWFTVDLRQQRLKRRFKQGCKMCGEACRPMVRDMVAFAEHIVARYIELRDRDPNAPIVPRTRDDRSGQAPHRTELCEKCEYGRFKCWLPRDAQG